MSVSALQDESRADRAVDVPLGTVTFLFSDVQDSMRLWERHTEAMRLALGRHDALIENVVAEHGGVVVRPRGEGDSRFAVFARAVDAVVAACAIQLALARETWPLREPLLVRIAIHTGRTELRAGDYYGPDVNRCARLRSLAHGGQTLVSGVTARLVAGELAVPIAQQDLGSYRLKGLRDPERVYQLVHPEMASAFAPLGPQVHPSRRANFVGRRTDLRTLRGALDSAAAGNARVVLVSGEPGIGKTRLAEEFATLAEGQGFSTVWGQCRDEEGVPPFWPWLQVVRALRGPQDAQVPRNLAALVAPHLEASADRFQLFESVSVFLSEAAADRPRVIVLDDLQWADEASIALLRFAVREVRNAELVLMCLYRGPEVGPSHPFGQLAGELAAHAVQVHLGGLRRSEVDQLVKLIAKRHSTPELVETVASRTSGNPSAAH